MGGGAVGTANGTLTVDLPPEPSGDTAMHLTFPNDTWVGDTAPGKVSAQAAYVTEAGTGQLGSIIYIGGWCVANIAQYQRKDPSAAVTNTTAQDGYNITLFNNSTPRNSIGGTSELLYVENGATADIDSVLPSVFEITSWSKLSLLQSIKYRITLLTSADFDSDPYYMSYYQPYVPSLSDEVWDATHQCSLANLLPDGGLVISGVMIKVLGRISVDLHAKEWKGEG